MQHPRFELIRQRYRYMCGYCGITEISFGGELTIDHFRPRAAGGNDDLENLVYACLRCNLYKHDFWPTLKDVEQQHRILHPQLDEIAPHIRLTEQTGFLESLTETGRFHITLLRLNRPQLVRHRLGLQLQDVLQEKYRLLEQQITELQATMVAQERYIAALETQIEQLHSSATL